MLELLLTLAIVTQDQIPLRGAPEENAPRHAVLTQGDTLEVRGVKGDYLQVYDHRRERAGYVLATQAARHELDARTAPKLLAVAQFLKDQPGSEALGIAYSAAFLKAAPAEMIDAGAFEALGTMADRLAWRASRVTQDNEKAARIVSAHLETAASYGVAFYSVERNDKITLCYEGDAWRRVMALPASPAQKAGAALSLTRHDCVKTTLLPSERLDVDLARAATLGRVLEGKDLPEHLRNRLKIRAAGVWAGVAQQRAIRPDSNPAAVLEAGQTAETLLAGIDKNALTGNDRIAWNLAAIRVGASRWAAQPQTLAQPAKGRPGIALAVGEKPGQTCIKVIPASGGKNAPGDDAQHCTFGHVWTASLAVSPDGNFMTLAVQPLATWRELWVFHKEPNGWQLDIVPPSVDQPELGYIEFAGWVPGNQQMLVAREIVAGGQYKTSFELWNRATLTPERRADQPGSLTAFYRWQDPVWKSGTVAVR